MKNKIEIQLGSFIKKHLNNIMEYLDRNPNHIKELTDINRSKKIFKLGVNIPFMGEQDIFLDKNGIRRCWEEPIYKEKYYFNSQWGSEKEGQKRGDSFIKYLVANNLLLDEYGDKDIKFITRSQSTNSDTDKFHELSPIEGVINKEQTPLNQILYGPPGTGKTYSTVGTALNILLGEKHNSDIKSTGKLKAKFGSQVEFVTFHQSFSYEDFVEGLKAKTEDGEISYEIEDGVFKEICNNASSKAEITNVGIKLEKDITIWKMSLGSKGDTAKQYFSEAEESDSLVLGWGGLVDFTDCKNREEINEKLGKNIKASQVNYFKNEMKIGDIVIISDGNYKFKAIAEITGKYYFDEASELPQKRKIKWLQKFSNSRPVLEISSKNFTQTTINKPKHIDRDKLQAYLTDKQSIDNNKPYILIIDEINRGNISRIFGELITLIESSKRAGNDEEISVKLPYSKEEFSVPNNLYIIGTMNTADRSLALMDTALRRRFDFIEMMPDVGLITDDCDGVNLQKMLETINQRIEVLYDREHTIGHAFFMKVDNLEKLKNAFKNKILPLLEEYFYDDFEKIGQVLADKNGNFYKEKPVKDGLFLGMEVDTQSRVIYQKQDIDKLDVDAFTQIYKQK